MKTDLVPANTTLTAVPVVEKTELSTAQNTALEALLAGMTATDAAAMAGVSRRTVYTWTRQDYAFQAALNRGRQELKETISCRLDQIASDAAECVSGAVRKGDVKTALEVLKRTGALTPPVIGSDDELILQLEQDERDEMLQMQISLAKQGHEQSPAKRLPR